ncbi:hypothetical protein [Bacillus cereus]
MTITEQVGLAYRGRKAIDKLYKALPHYDYDAEAVEKLQDALSRHITALQYVKYFNDNKPMESLDELLSHYRTMQDELFEIY